MKAEEIIAMDTKTIREVLNYHGVVFSRMLPKIKDEHGNYLTEVRVRHCPKCQKETKQEWVRNNDFHYWRCSECLEKHLKENGIYSTGGYCKGKHIEALRKGALRQYEKRVVK